MTRTAALLALALLAGCQNLGGLVPGAPSGNNTNNTVTTPAAGAAQSQAAQQAPKTASAGQATPDGAKLGGTGVKTSADGEAPGSTSAPVQNPVVDRTKKLEYADIYVDLKDPQGQKALVPYLLKPEDWTIVKVEHLSPTYKHYRFQRVASNDGTALPEVDPLKPKKTPPPGQP